MVSVMKGLNVQKSRFAVLSLEQDSDDEEDHTQWQQVGVPKSKAANKKGSSQGGQGQSQGEEGKGLSKNAKKRARKKRNKSTSSDHDAGEAGTDNVATTENSYKVSEDMQTQSEIRTEYDQVWRKKNEQAMEEEFQKNLRQALMQSTMEAKQEKMLKDMREAEQRAMSASVASNKPTKKAVKLSLQELHNLSSPDQITAPALLPPQPWGSPDDMVFSPMEVALEERPCVPFLEEVEAEIYREMNRSTKQEKVHTEEEMGMIPRIAHLEDELEKRDKVIARLKKENTALKKSMTEVKERNQSLCTIMSQGEFSKKAELLKEVDELSTVKNDLTLEVENLSSLLEQERSKNKALKVELTKLQNSHAKLSKNSTSH